MKWKISSSLVTGTIHDSERCQDNNSRHITDDCAMIVVCDGASSSSHAYEASRLACDIFTDIVAKCGVKLFDMTDDELRALVVGTVSGAVADAARAAGCDIDDFLTTLAAVICTPESYIALNIGDGLVGYLPDDEEIGGEALLKPVKGKFANTCYFISQPDAAEHLEISRGKFCVEASYFVLTDGAVHCLFNRRNTSFAPALRTYSGWLRNHAFNKAQKAISKSMAMLFPQLTADDCTLVLLRADPN